MEESIEKSKSKQPGRLVIKGLSGYYEYGRIPFKIHYNLKSSTSEGLDEKNPGLFMLTQDIGPYSSGQQSISISIHESVPKEYRDVVLFHELKEAEHIYADGVDRKEAHEQAVIETEEYAKKYLSEEEFKKFLEWQKGLNTY